MAATRVPIYMYIYICIYVMFSDNTLGALKDFPNLGKSKLGPDAVHGRAGWICDELLMSTAPLQILKLGESTYPGHDQLATNYV